MTGCQFLMNRWPASADKYIFHITSNQIIFIHLL